MEVLKVDNLSKNYGAIKALNGVSFSVPAGSIFGILGPNGSGKTTLLGIVMDVLKATSGNFLWNGQPANSEARKQIGTLLETPNFYHYLSGQKNLEINAEIKGRSKSDITRVLDIVNLSQRKHSKFSTYSLGMKQRLAIANALLGNPDILVFDEPTNGLDPAGIAEIRELMIKLSADGKTIIMASHILDEVERVCTHVAIIQKGDLKTVGTVSEVLNTTTKDNKDSETIEVEISTENLVGLKKQLENYKDILSIKEQGNLLVLQTVSNISAGNLNKYCMENGFVLSHLNLKKKSLESRFLEITGSKSDR
jgi:ABC-type multidrug transport system ATPase subunit